MQYLLLMYGNETAMMSLPKDEAMKMHGAFMAYTEAMKKDGVLLANHGLRPAAETKTVRQSKVSSGPSADTPERLAGYYLIDVDDLDAAVSWAKRCPTAAYGAVEVRPVWA